MQLSIVTTLYRSATHLDAFYGEMTRQAQRLTPDYELILVNDGSPDESLEVALALHHRDPRVRVIDLSRNFGHHRAMMTGLTHARGELVFLIDCDLEEDPALLVRFHEEVKRTGADVVYGVQERRRGGIVERLSGWLFFRIFNLLSSVQIPTNFMTVRLMTRRYVRGLVAHSERETFFAGLCALTGFEQVPVFVRKGSRSQSTYSLLRKLEILINAVTSFSERPLVLIFCLGMAVSVAAGLAALQMVIRRLFFGVFLAGWPSLIVSVWFLGGLTLLSLGLIGIYLSRMFVETKARPYVIIREVHDRSEELR